MKGFKRDRARRPGHGRPGPARRVEALERRELLTLPPHAINHYSFADVQPRTVDPTSGQISVAHPIGLSDRQLSKLDNEGRYITGKDRQGDEYTLTLHGPGALIVTDVTPNDGALDDDIDTIQIVGSDPHSTYVTGQVTATARPIVAPDTGVVYFGHLIAERGVRSIILNGFSLNSDVGGAAFQANGQPQSTGPEIFLPGGVKTLSFHDIINVTDEAGNGNGTDQPVEVVIGDPTTPLRKRFAPTIQLDHIYNSVVDPTAASQEGLGPQTNATVNIVVNGDIHALNIASATAQTITGGYQFEFPLVDITGRTAIRARGIDHLKVVGSARNLTASRAGRPVQFQAGQTGAATNATTGTEPFTSSFSGLDYLKTADFGGTADAVGLDVKGKVGRVRFLRGAGSPVGKPLNATQFGYNAGEAGYPSRGLTGALVTGRRIRKLEVGPSQLILQTPQDPDYTQIQRRGSTTYYARPGQALVNAAIVSSGSIGSVNEVGLSQQSEIAAGYHYRSFVNGLEPVRARSGIRNFRQRGDLVDSVVSATYRPNDGIYGNGDDTAGPGVIRGNLKGRLYSTGSQTVLGSYGVGVYAKKKIGHLPPPETRIRSHRGDLLR